MRRKCRGDAGVLRVGGRGFSPAVRRLADKGGMRPRRIRPGPALLPQRGAIPDKSAIRLKREEIMLKQASAPAGETAAFDAQADISARLERLPITRYVFWMRNIIGAATFFDGY